MAAVLFRGGQNFLRYALFLDFPRPWDYNDSKVTAFAENKEDSYEKNEEIALCSSGSCDDA